MEKVFFLKENEQPLYVKLYDSIISEISEGTLTVDEKMPSVRQLSKGMNLSRNTVETAYSQLVAEGYLYAKPQKGYYVMNIHPVKSIKDKREYFDQVTGKINQKIKYDFVGEYVESTNFNMAVWKKNINQVLATEEEKLFSYAEPFGEEELKTAIVEYFTRTRGIKARKEQVIIGAGTSAVIGNLSQLLYEQGYSQLCIDSPGFIQASKEFEKNDYKIKGIPLNGHVIDCTKVMQETHSVLFTSPSYQFPYGEIMPMNTRNKLLYWAEKTDSYIIEDDYNNELRYVGKPVPSLQGMDVHDRVVYLGSFSTLLVPSIRISFLVLPEKLAKEYQKEYVKKVQSASKLEQLALARMIESGDFGKHVRKIRKSYKQKNLRIKELCNIYFDDIGKVHIPLAGLTCVIELKNNVNLLKLQLLSYERNVNLLGISQFMAGNDGKGLEKKLVLNYRGIRETDLEEGLRRIKELICLVC